MRIIDEKGRLFGVVNIIDAFVVVVVIAIFASGIMFVLQSGQGSTSTSTEGESSVTVIVLQASVPPYVADSISGGPVQSDDVVRVEEIAYRESDTTLQLRLKLKTSTTSAGEIHFQGDRLYVDRQLTLAIGQTRIQGTVIRMGSAAEKMVLVTPTPTPTLTPTPTPTLTPTPTPTLTPTPTQNVTLSVAFRIEQVQPYVVTAIPEGSVENTHILQVRQKTVRRAEVVVQRQDGQLVVQKHPRLKTVILRLELRAVKRDNEVLFRGTPVFVGQQLTLRLGSVRVTGKVVRMSSS